MPTQIWAHRGSSATMPENTLAAFDLAARQGADGIELDVQLSSDGHIVVIHDETCLRTAGVDRPVAGMTLAELRQLDFAVGWPGQPRQPAATLADVFDLVKPTGMTINIELKNGLEPYPGLEHAVLQEAVRMNMAGRICLSSFNHYSMVLAARLCREARLPVPCGLLYSCGIYEPWRYASQLGVHAIHPLYVNLQIPHLVKDCHTAGIPVNAWTIDRPDHLKMAFHLGIDAVITNVPDLALSIRSQLHAGQAQGPDPAEPSA